MKFKQYLKESSLSRIWEYIENNKKSFAVISAFRGERSKEENEEKHNELKSKVRELGLGYIEMRGGYKEDTGFVNEKSLFIPNIQEKQAVKLGKEFDQDGILFKDSQGNFNEINTKNSLGSRVAKFVTNAKKDNISMSQDIIKNFFSALMKGSHSGKKFVFKLQEKEYIGHLGRMSGRTPEWKTIYEEELN